MYVAGDINRIAQEALSNVARHANATRLKVTLAQATPTDAR